MATMSRDKKFQRIALIGKYRTESEGVRSILLDIAKMLDSLGHEVIFAKDTAQSLQINGFASAKMSELGSQVDVALVVGGDGTMLGVARMFAPLKVPLIGINQGRLGFITDISLQAYPSTVPVMLSGNYESDFRSLLRARVMRGSTCVFETLALNDVVVNRGAIGGMVELRVEVDGHYVATHRADGLIVATPTGSTAYALSAGGPVLYPDVQGWVLVPIAPHTLSNRPLVLSDPSEVVLEVVDGRAPSANFDMQSFDELEVGDRIVVTRSEHQAEFLHPTGWNYFDTLRAKLHWNEGS